MRSKVAHGSRRWVRVAVGLSLTGLFAMLSGGMLLVIGSPASSVPDDQCVPSEAWTETDWYIESPGEDWYLTGEERTVEDEAATWDETDWLTESPGEGWIQFDQRDSAVVDVAEQWQHYSLKGSSGIGKDEVPVFPADYWQANTEQEPHTTGQAIPAYNVDGTPYVDGDYGLHYTSAGSAGDRDWFYFEWVEATYQQEYRYYLDTPAVTHVEYQYALDHPAVQCPIEPNQPNEPNEPPEVLGEEDSDPAPSPEVEVRGEQATRTDSTVPRAVAAGVVGQTTEEQWGARLLGGGLVLVLAAGGTLLAARRREAS